jgi:hypothetical protein
MKLVTIRTRANALSKLASIHTVRPLAIAAAVGVGILATGASASEQVSVESSAIRSEALDRRVHRDYGGRYQMQDGSMLQFSKLGNRVLATRIDLDSGKTLSEHEVRAIATNKFADLATGTEYRFSHPHGNDTVTMRLPSGVTIASVGTRAQATRKAG